MQPSHIEITEIGPESGWSMPDLRELAAHREVLYFLALRDIKVRYKQTILGASWAVIQPVATTFIFTVFFGRLAGIPSDGVPYYLFSLASTVPWAFFSNAVTQATQSVVGNSNIVTKVYFPRLLVPLASVTAALVDFVLGFGLLIVVVLSAGFIPGTKALLIPFFVLLAIVSALGLGFLFAALNVQFRDIRQLIPFIMQLLLFATPIAYPSSIVGDRWRVFLGINPMTSVVEGFRWCLLDAETTLNAPMILISTVVAAALLVCGVVYYQRTAQRFADII